MILLLIVILTIQKQLIVPKYLNKTRRIKFMPNDSNTNDGLQQNDEEMKEEEKEIEMIEIDDESQRLLGNEQIGNN